jgi:hypothetical protein
MNAVRTRRPRTPDFRRTARHVFAVVSRKISSAVERVATSDRGMAADYPRFPWF